MIAVNGISGSGLEAVLASFKTSTGTRHLADTSYSARDRSKNSGSKQHMDYENYLDKFSSADRAAVVADIEGMAPDGVWPLYNMEPDIIRILAPGGVEKLDIAARLGGSLFSFTTDEISKVYLVTVSPAVLWLRRNGLHFAFRRLDVKYGDDYGYRRASQTEFRMSSSMPRMLIEDYSLFKDYASRCLSMFGDKVVFIDGDKDTLTFEHEGKTVTVTNRNVHKHPMTGKAPQEALLHNFNNNEQYEEVRTLWKDIQDMVSSRTPSLIKSSELMPNSWWCARTRSSTTFRECAECLSSLGESVITKVKPGWDAEPCAYEVAYGPEPHKTIEESIANHNWGVLP